MEAPIALLGIMIAGAAAVVCAFVWQVHQNRRGKAHVLGASATADPLWALWSELDWLVRAETDVADALEDLETFADGGPNSDASASVNGGRPAIPAGKPRFTPSDAEALRRAIYMRHAGRDLLPRVVRGPSADSLQAYLEGLEGRTGRAR